MFLKPELSLEMIQPVNSNDEEDAIGPDAQQKLCGKFVRICKHFRSYYDSDMDCGPEKMWIYFDSPF